jgi:hypothetical protein
LKNFITILLILFYQNIFAEILELKPEKIEKIELSFKAEKKYQILEKKVIDIMNKLSQNTPLTQSEKKILDSFDETKSDYWDIIGQGDGWYNAGGPYDVNASSTLVSKDENAYAAKNAHDHSYKTAWIEGVKGYGIKEYITYYFKPEAPRVDTIIVVNGYVKDKDVWKNNSRVKKLLLYYNEKPYAVLNLKDVIGKQFFKLEPFGHNEREPYEDLMKKSSWKLKFEILDVYKGLKYDDTVITEIYFDGLDVL